MRRIGWLAVLAVSAAGCGGAGQPSLAAPVPVSGKVTFADGKPVAGVTVYFQPMDAPAPAFGKTKDDGSFTLTTYESKEGICKGKYMVFLRPVIGGAAEQGKSTTTLKSVPDRYKDDAGKSPLEVTIESPGQSVELKVDAK